MFAILTLLFIQDSFLSSSHNRTLPIISKIQSEDKKFRRTCERLGTDSQVIIQALWHSDRCIRFFSKSKLQSPTYIVRPPGHLSDKKCGVRAVLSRFWLFWARVLSDNDSDALARCAIFLLFTCLLLQTGIFQAQAEILNLDNRRQNSRNQKNMFTNICSKLNSPWTEFRKCIEPLSFKILPLSLYITFWLSDIVNRAWAIS